MNILTSTSLTILSIALISCTPKGASDALGIPGTSGGEIDESSVDWRPPTATTVPGSAPTTTLPKPPVAEVPLKIKDVLANFPKGAASIAALCVPGNRGADRFTTTFCGATPPAITGITSLYAALGLNNVADAACTTNSVSLVKTETSVLNPRCIRFSANGAAADATAVGYLRAELTFAEVVARDPANGRLRFFLVDFELPCESSVAGCTKADFYLPAAEQNWRNVSLFEDTQLQNTIMDCTMCHQPGGAAAPKTLRMAETDNPWTHWFRNNRECGQTLTADFLAAHNGEAAYAGMPMANITNSDPARLENFVEGNGFQGANNGNNFFNSNAILGETDNTGQQPQSNAVATTSATWLAAMRQRAAAVNLTAFGGVQMPYRDCKQSDPVLLPQFTNLYTGVRAGTLPAAMMPSLPEVNLATEQALRDRSILPALNQTGPQILANACLSCHNSNLNQTISRAKFNAQNLALNTAAEYDIAINRISREKDDLRKMPPHTHMDLSVADIAVLKAFFETQKLTAPQ